MSIKRNPLTGEIQPSQKAILARERSQRYILKGGSDSMARYVTGGAILNPRPPGTAPAPAINLMTLPVYRTGDGECTCGCGSRPGCSDFLSINSKGEAD